LFEFETDASVSASVIKERLVVDRKNGAVAKLIGLIDGVGNELRGELGGRTASGSIVKLWLLRTRGFVVGSGDEVE